MIGDPGKRGTFCIDTAERSSASWDAAHLTCLGVNDPVLGRAHLCTYEEWRTACEVGGPVNMTNGNYEWISELNGDKAVSIGSSSCVAMANADRTTYYTPFRCCLR